MFEGKYISLFLAGIIRYKDLWNVVEIFDKKVFLYIETLPNVIYL